MCTPVADRLVGREAALTADTAIGLGAAGSGLRSDSKDGGAGFGAGFSSTVECLPVVQGGMERNSSNVRTRGLQHVQPKKRVPSVDQLPFESFLFVFFSGELQISLRPTFLAFMEFWWTWMV